MESVKPVAPEGKSLCVVAGLALGFAPVLAAVSPLQLSWRQLPPLPDPSGFASSFVGVDGDELLLAGGANFPQKQLWEGGRKIWHDRVFVLHAESQRWDLAGNLPLPMAYGLSVSTGNGVLCAGGSDAERHYSSVFLLQWRNGKLQIQTLPSLPKPVAMGAGARAGNIVYLAGGLETPQSKDSMSTFFSLDLKNLAAGWRSLPTWPGPGRSQAVAAAVGDDFFLFSGLSNKLNEQGGSELIYLKDAYRYSPERGWRKLTDVPFPAVAAGSPAPFARSEVLLIGGVDGTGAGKDPREFYQAPQRIQAYSVETDSWREAGNAPVGRACVTTAEWSGRWVLPSGERSPGIRSPEVWAMEVLTPLK